MAKIVGKGRNTWNDGSAMTYTITDDGVLTISGTLKHRMDVRIKAKAPFHHMVIAEGITIVGSYNFCEMDALEELTLPSTVTRIGKEAFCECKNLKRINFAEGLDSIGKDAFNGCEALEELHLPQSVTKIEEKAFGNCSSLTKVTLPKNLKSIGCMVFDCCKSLLKIKVPAGVTTIGDRAFRLCTSLKEVTLPKGLKEIEKYAFDRCYSLEKINFPTTIESIGCEAFAECNNLHDVVLPKNAKLDLWAFDKGTTCSVTGPDGMEYVCYISNIKTNVNNVSLLPDNSDTIKGDLVIPGEVEHEGKTFEITVIRESAFAECQEITSVTLPDTITKIEEAAFQNCRNLKSVKMGKSVRVIESLAFNACGLTNVELNDSLEFIGMDAFAECSHLEHIQIPASLLTLGVKALDHTAFYYSQKGLYYAGHIALGYRGSLPRHAFVELRKGTTIVAEAAFRERSNLEGVVLPNGIKSINYAAFNDCENLKYVNLPKSLTNIGEDAFTFTAIKEIEAPWKKPIEIGYGSFPDGTVVYIPKGSLEAYSNNQRWSEYKLVER